MQHSELLHRFFDEGLEEPLEDVLFGQMALDPELRREFISHLKFHSIIQEDVAGITTPSHVSRQLFTTLGLTPPEMAPVSTAARLRDGAGAAWLRIRGFADAHRQHLYTAVLSALLTALLLLNFTMPRVELLVDHRADETASPHESLPVVEHGAAGRTTAPETRTADATAPETRTADATAPETRTADATAPEGINEHLASSVQPANRSVPTMPLPGVGVSPAQAAAVPSGTLKHASGTPAVAVLPAALPIEERVAMAAPAGFVPDDAGVEIAKVAVEDAPWSFSQPGPRENILSNLVFELRKIYGTSYPDVDLPHNSFTVFQDMAISAIYKTTEHHAFGFEYGRESFGREFQRSVSEQGATLSHDPSMVQIYRPPAEWLNAPQRENRMLDVFGAVWKLSLPEYGMFNLVYPYLRTFVGATKLGPLGKVRAGIEMYPSNFSMLNVGVEGGMLRYSVDAQAYYTAKLNFTFGVAIGF